MSSVGVTSASDARDGGEVGEVDPSSRVWLLAEVTEQLEADTYVNIPRDNSITNTLSSVLKLTGNFN